MALKDNDLKKMMKDFVKKDSPELADVEPVISEEERAVSEEVGRKLGLPAKKAVKKVKVLTYKKMVTAEDGAKFPLITRITVDEDGNVIKTTGN